VKGAETAYIQRRVANATDPRLSSPTIVDVLNRTLLWKQEGISALDDVAGRKDLLVLFTGSMSDSHYESR